MAELGEVDTQIEAYEVDEDIALASAALFSRHTLAEESVEAGTPIDEYKKFLDVDASGCIFLNDSNNQVVCRIYVLTGIIVGIYSPTQGWLERDINLVEDMVDRNPEFTCETFFMPTLNMQEVYKEGFAASPEAGAIINFDCTLRQPEERVDLFANYVVTFKRNSSFLADKVDYIDSQKR